MVTYRSITVLLRSHFDPLQCIPEFTPAPTENKAEAEDSDEKAKVESTVSQSTDPDSSEVSVYIPSLQAGQFSIDYAVAPPQPESIHFYFKLFIDGKHIVSWGVDERQNFRGRTTFALYDTPRGTKATRIYEKRGFFFSSATKQRNNAEAADDGDSHLQIRVYRAESRRRLPPILDKFKKSALGKEPSKEVKLVNVGTQKWHPQRFYEFLLIDPPRRPFAHFNYYIKPWDELNKLNLVSKELAPLQIITPPLALDGTRNSRDSSTGLRAANTEKPLSSRYHKSRFTEHCSAWGEYASEFEGKSVSERLKKLSLSRKRSSLRVVAVESAKPEIADFKTSKQLPPIPECDSTEAIVLGKNGASKSREVVVQSEASSGSSRALLDTTRHMQRGSAGNNALRDGILKSIKERWMERKSEKSK